MTLLLLLTACGTDPVIESVAAECVPEGHFDDLFVFEATTSGVVASVTLRMVLDEVAWSLLPLTEEAEDTWTGEMWGSTANADCTALDDVVYRLTATGEDGLEDVFDLEATSSD